MRTVFIKKDRRQLHTLVGDSYGLSLGEAIDESAHAHARQPGPPGAGRLVSGERAEDCCPAYCGRVKNWLDPERRKPKSHGDP